MSTRSITRALLAVLAVQATEAVPAVAQETTPPGARAAGEGAAPARRSADGRLEVLAVPAGAGVKVDGVLDEAVWAEARPVGDFVQAEPVDGQPATERTEVRVAYDEVHLYVGAQLYDSEPDALVVRNIRKDFDEGDGDTFEVLLDTFADRRNGYVFMTNPEGAKADRQIANEGRETNASWDAVWSVKTRRTPEGWTVEMAIPFRALRFEPGAGKVWGINFSRRIRRKNETDFWSPVPRSYNLARVSLAGNLAGLPAATLGRDLRIKPYVAAATVREVGPPGYTEEADGGVDVKYRVAEGLTLDLTFRPDFAQAEADEQTVNLSQFSQFFPEKRDFFLENSGIFYVGDAVRNNRSNPTPTPDEDLLLFFSRRIGLTRDGREVPIDGGVRLTGNLGGVGIGALAIRTDARNGNPASDYGVVRLRRNVLAGSDIGAIFMTRRSTDDGEDYNRVYGADANVRFPFLGDIDWNSYLVRTETPGLTEGQYAWRSTLLRQGNFYTLKAGVLQIGENFNNELGYYRRTGARKYIFETGLRFRKEALRRNGIRELNPHLTWQYHEDLQGDILGKRLHNGFIFILNSGTNGEFAINPLFERPLRAFQLHKGVRIPAAGYGWSESQFRIASDPSRLFSVSFRGIAGGLWSGTQRTANIEMALKPSYRFRATLGVQRTAAELEVPRAEFVKTLWTARTNYSFTTNMFVDALAQYDPSERQLNTNVRFNLIHHPLSDLFIVYNEQRTSTLDGPPPGRSMIVKFTHMLAF